jgi:hypothetical protein
MWQKPISESKALHSPQVTYRYSLSLSVKIIFISLKKDKEK